MIVLIFPILTVISVEIPVRMMSGEVKALIDVRINTSIMDIQQSIENHLRMKISSVTISFDENDEPSEILISVKEKSTKTSVKFTYVELKGFSGGLGPKDFPKGI